MKSTRRIAVVGLGAAIVLAGAGVVAWPHLRAQIRRLGADELSVPVELKQVDLREPSGIAYLPSRGTLAAVSDDGVLVEMDLSLKTLHSHPIDGDLEAVTPGLASSTLLVTLEDRDSIIEYDLDEKRVLRTWHVDLASSADFKNRHVRNKGFEGVAVVPAADGPRLYSIVEADPARLIKLDAQLSKKTDAQGEKSASIASSIDVGLSRLSDVMYDEVANKLLFVSADERTLSVADMSGRVERRIRLPGRKPEGFCFTPNGDGLVADDGGGVYLCKGMRAVVFPPAGAAGAPH